MIKKTRRKNYLVKTNDGDFVGIYKTKTEAKEAHKKHVSSNGYGDRYVPIRIVQKGKYYYLVQDGSTLTKHGTIEAAEKQREKILERQSIKPKKVDTQKEGFFHETKDRPIRIEQDEKGWMLVRESEKGTDYVVKRAVSREDAQHKKFMLDK